LAALEYLEPHRWPMAPPPHFAGGSTLAMPGANQFEFDFELLDSNFDYHPY